VAPIDSSQLIRATDGYVGVPPMEQVALKSQRFNPNNLFFGRCIIAG